MRVLILLLLLLPSVLSSQPNFDSKSGTWNTRVFYDNDGKEVKEKSASSYLLVNLAINNQVQGKAKLLSISKDEVVWEGFISEFNRSNFNLSKKDGKCTWFHKNGKISRESSFKEGILHGSSIFYDEGGNKIYSGNYINGKLENGRMIQYEEGGSTSRVYVQNFDGFYDSWDEEKNIDGRSYFNNKHLWIQALEKNGYTRKEYVQIDTKNDFTIEFGLYPYDVESFTVFFGFQDYQNYYSVTISRRGFLKVNNYFEGINLVENQWLPITIDNKSNLLKVLRMGDYIAVSWNGNIISSHEFSKFYGHYIGFTVPTKFKQLGISHIRVKEFSQLSKSSKTQRRNDNEAKSPARKEVRESRQESNNSESSDFSDWNVAGTGFYVSSNGLVLTNYHVIEGQKKIGITQFLDGRKTILNAKIIMSDPNNDLALLQINDTRFQSPGIIPYTIKPDIAEVGEAIFTMGYPLAGVLGDEIKITDGIISARSGLQGDSKMYQISAPITYGNSGGPLLDKEGNLLGINTSGITQRNLAENTSYSIKSSIILNLLNSSNDEIKIENKNLLKGRVLKDQIKVLRNFVPMICVQ